MIFKGIFKEILQKSVKIVFYYKKRLFKELIKNRFFKKGFKKLLKNVHFFGIVKKPSFW